MIDAPLHSRGRLFQGEFIRPLEGWNSLADLTNRLNENEIVIGGETFPPGSLVWTGARGLSDDERLEFTASVSEAGAAEMACCAWREFPTPRYGWREVR